MGPRRRCSCCVFGPLTSTRWSVPAHPRAQSRLTSRRVPTRRKVKLWITPTRRVTPPRNSRRARPSCDAATGTDHGFPLAVACPVTAVRVCSAVESPFSVYFFVGAPVPEARARTMACPHALATLSEPQVALTIPDNALGCVSSPACPLVEFTFSFFSRGKGFDTCCLFLQDTCAISCSTRDRTNVQLLLRIRIEEHGALSDCVACCMLTFFALFIVLLDASSKKKK